MLNDSNSVRCQRDSGSALIMAVLVSVVVFLLGATWMSMASHESSASNGDRRRQQAIDAAMAGLVFADSELTRNALYAGSGSVAVPFPGGSAEFVVTVSVVDSAPGGFRRLVTSVGYAPSKAEPLQTVRTVQQVVDLEPVGFTYGIFSKGRFVTGSSSTVIGDVYSNTDITLGNSQDYVGHMYTLGSIDTGSNQTITGSLHANQTINVRSGSTTVNGSAFAGGDILTGGMITDAAQAGGAVDDCGDVQGTCLQNSPPPAVPAQSLPAFVWNPADYSSVAYPANGTAFVDQVTKTTSSGVFYIDGNVSFDANDDIWLGGDMTIVATGSITLPRAIANKTSGGQAVQLTVISTGVGAAGTITPANNLTIPTTVRALIYTQGVFAAKNSSAFTGVLYAGEVSAGAHLSVTYAPVGSSGFDWSAASPQKFTIRNISTREIANAP